jgi:hypothetical protein
LVDVARVDLDQDLAFGDLVAFTDLEALDVADHARRQVDAAIGHDRARNADDDRHVDRLRRDGLKMNALRVGRRSDFAVVAA